MSESRSYEITFSPESWRCAREAVIFGIVLRKGQLYHIAHICDIRDRDRFQTLFTILVNIEKDFKNDFVEHSNVDEIQCLFNLLTDLELSRSDAKDNNSIQISLSIENTKLLSRETERLARTYMAQLDVVYDVWIGMYTERFLELRERIDRCRYLVNGLDQGYYSLTSPEYPNDGRILFDINQVLRHRIAWDLNPAGGIYVCYDTPRNYAVGVPLITIRKGYSAEAHACVARAIAWVEQKKAEGWTRQDAAESLKRMLESDTGDDDCLVPTQNV